MAAVYDGEKWISIWRECRLRAQSPIRSLGWLGVRAVRPSLVGIVFTAKIRW